MGKLTLKEERKKYDIKDISNRKIFTIGQAMVYYSKSYDWIVDAANEGFPVSNIGGTLYVSRSRADEWFDKKISLML